VDEGIRHGMHTGFGRHFNLAVAFIHEGLLKQFDVVFIGKFIASTLACER
jgi:hypothetical protein